MRKSFILLSLPACLTTTLCAIDLSDSLAKTTHSAPPHQLHGYQEINTTGVWELLQSGQPVMILDARTAEYDDGLRIPGAIRLPYNSTTDEISATLPSKEAVIVTYCSGPRCPASKYLAEQLVKLGYSNVRKYLGGLDSWTEAGYQVSQE